MEDSLQHALLKTYSDMLAIALEVGNSAVIEPNSNHAYASGLGKKVIMHSLSIRHLYSGYQLTINETMFTPIVDFASIFVLARTAVEAYLTFNYLFIAPKDLTEQEFRLLCWNLAGLIERTDVKARSQEHLEAKQKEEQRIITLKETIKSHPIFNTLRATQQENVLKGKWQLKKWHQMAVDSGFNETYFVLIYRLFCCYAHSSMLSIMQIQQIQGVDKQKSHLNSSMSFLLSVLAKYTLDFVNLIPSLKASINLTDAKFKSVIHWKEVAYRIDVNSDDGEGGASLDEWCREYLSNS